MQPKVRHVEAHFDDRAAGYDTWYTRTIGACELVIVRKFLPTEGSILDYGAGSGRTTLDLLERGLTVTAFDCSREMLAIARRKAERGGHSAEFIEQQAELVGRTWPSITCIGVFDYYPDPRPLLNELRGYLSANGQLIATVPNAQSPLGWAYELGSRARLRIYPKHVAEFRKLAPDAGLKLAEVASAFPALGMLGMTAVMRFEAR